MFVAKNIKTISKSNIFSELIRIGSTARVEEGPANSAKLSSALSLLTSALILVEGNTGQAGRLVNLAKSISRSVSDE